MNRFVKKLLPLCMLIVMAVPMQASATEQNQTNLNELQVNNNCYSNLYKQQSLNLGCNQNPNLESLQKLCKKFPCELGKMPQNWIKTINVSTDQSKVTASCKQANGDASCKQANGAASCKQANGDASCKQANGAASCKQANGAASCQQSKVTAPAEQPKVTAPAEQPKVTAPTEQPKVTAPTAPASQPNSASIGAYEQQIVTLVNQERAKQGLSPLTLNAKLSSVAETKAADMRDKNYFSHTSPTYGSPFDMMKKFGITYKSAGENIAKGQKTPESVMNGWMNSEGHRANILNANYTEIGVGYVTDSNGNTYWVQMFIRP